MKKKLLLILLSLMAFVLLLTGCEDSSSEQPDSPQNPGVEDNNDEDEDKSEDTVDKEEKELRVSSYYPIKENVRYIYEGKGNEFAGYDRYTSYTKEDKVQYRVDNSGTVSAEIVEIKDGEVRQMLSRAESYYQEDLLRDGILKNINKKDTEVLLKEPIEQGNSWKLNDGRERKITDISADVSTPYSDYKAVEVTTEGLNDSKSMDYYVEGVGLVKSIYIAEGIEVISTLKDIEEDAKVTQNVKFFYPNIDDERLHYKEKQVDFSTNDISRMTLEKAYKNTLKDLDSVVLTENTKVNSLYLNDDGMVYLDLSEDFLSEMNAGSGYESQILQSVGATFGSYYGVDKVVLTIDGGDYESGHIVLEDGDYLEFDAENAVHKK